MRLIATFKTKPEAERDARKYDRARAFSKLDKLVVEELADGRWGVYNPGNHPRTAVLNDEEE